MVWKNIYRGFIMGISDLIPGVSGGTIAVILGMYDQLLETISGFFSREWKRHLRFLIPLAIGVVSALLLLSRLIEYLLEHYYVPTQFFFIGLIIGVIPLLLKESGARKYFKLRHIIVLTVTAIFVASMAFLNPAKSVEPITSVNPLTFVKLFLSGWLASMAMLLPGISGSFILLLLGVYSTAIHALSKLNLPIIASIGLGVIVGFISSSKGIRYSLSHFPHMTYSTMIGLIIGSVFVLFPGIVTDTSTIVMSAVTFGLGLGVTKLFGTKKNIAQHSPSS